MSSIREVTGVDGRVLSSEVFTPGPGRARGAARARWRAPRCWPSTATTRPGRHGDGPVPVGPAGGRWLGAACGAGAAAAGRGHPRPPPGQRPGGGGWHGGGCANWSACAAAAALAVGACRAGGDPLAGGWQPGWRCWCSPGGAVRRGRERKAMARLEGAGHLDRVAARHDRRGGGPGTGDPGLAAGGGPGHPRAADRGWWTGCTSGCRCRTRCCGSPTTWTTRART